MKVTQQQIDNLRRLHLLGFTYREQLEAMVNEACTTLGVDPESDLAEQNWCSEIILHGTDPQIVIDRLATLRNQSESQ
jgi:hypothetical protein